MKEQMLLIDISPNRIPEVAAWVERQCHRFGLSETDGYKVKTCVVEAINNSVEHAYSGGCGNIRIVAWSTNGHVNIEISDFGLAPENSFGPYGGVVRPDLERGRGWLIMKAWMDQASFNRRGAKNIVRLVKRLAN